jgi:Protein of unknown function (DUF2769)
MKKEMPAKPEMPQAEINRSCICEGCPSYVDCSRKGATHEKAFCLIMGRSKCIIDEKGCICGACIVKSKMKLKDLYFCTKGTEEQQNIGRQTHT